MALKVSPSSPGTFLAWCPAWRSQPGIEEMLVDGKLQKSPSFYGFKDFPFFPFSPWNISGLVSSLEKPLEGEEMLGVQPGGASRRDACRHGPVTEHKGIKSPKPCRYLKFACQMLEEGLLEPDGEREHTV